MRFKARPRLAADPYPWHFSAAIVCVGQASNPGLLNGSCGQVPPGSLTPPGLCTISGLPQETGRGRPDWPQVPPVSFVLISAEITGAAEHLHSLGTTYFWSIRPSDKSTIKLEPRPRSGQPSSVCMDSPWVNCRVFLVRAAALDRSAGRPREVCASHWPD